jgi:phosphomannomutase
MPRHMPPKIGVSGVRGIVGESLTPQLVASFAAAFGNYSGAGHILIGTDSRPSREMVKQAVIAGLLSVGCTPVDAGIVPLPALKLHVGQAGAFGGIYISAGHNTMEWNALKFIGPDGIVLRPNQSAELTDLYHQGVYSRVGAQDIAEVHYEDTTLARHREAILRAVNADVIRARNFKVAIDCCNGTASQAAPALLRTLGCDVFELNTSMGPSFPRSSEPWPEYTEELCRMVKESGADIGFAQDEDADRLAVVSELGEPLGEECTIALAVDHWLDRRRGPVVVSMATSRMVDDIAAKHGVAVHRTPAGEVHVVDRMLECGAEIGGEGNGGVILRAVHPCRDSFAGMALLLEALAENRSRVSETRARIPKYAMVCDALLCPARDIAPLLRLLRGFYQSEKMDFTDGVKVLWPDRWLHARPSNTEPVIRLVAEAPTEAAAHALLVEALECLSP